MKNLLKIAATFALGAVLVSCGATDPYYGNRYPDNNRYPSNNGVYRAPDGTVYRTGEVYRDRSGNVYQNGRVIRRGDVQGRPGILSRNGNYPVYGNNRNLPPGQAKKVYGGKATDYAKGQQKKRNIYNNQWKKNDRDDDRDDDRRYRNTDYKKYKKSKGKKDRD